MTQQPLRSAPPVASNAKPGRISSRGESLLQPAGDSSSEADGRDGRPGLAGDRGAGRRRHGTSFRIMTSPPGGGAVSPLSPLKRRGGGGGGGGGPRRWTPDHRRAPPAPLASP